MAWIELTTFGMAPSPLYSLTYEVGFRFDLRSLLFFLTIEHNEFVTNRTKQSENYNPGFSKRKNKHFYGSR